MSTDQNTLKLKYQNKGSVLEDMPDWQILEALELFSRNQNARVKDLAQKVALHKDADIDYEDFTKEYRAFSKALGAFLDEKAGMTGVRKRLGKASEKSHEKDSELQDRPAITLIFNNASTGEEITISSQLVKKFYSLWWHYDSSREVAATLESITFGEFEHKPNLAELLEVNDLLVDKLCQVCTQTGKGSYPGEIRRIKLESDSAIEEEVEAQNTLTRVKRGLGQLRAKLNI